MHVERMGCVEWVGGEGGIAHPGGDSTVGDPGDWT